MNSMVGATDAAMTTKDVWQLAVSLVAPFVAAGGAVWLYALQQKERISCFIIWGFGREWEEISFIGIHNRSAQAVAITRIRYQAGVVFRKASQGTALDYEDPTDLAFPYLVAAGEIKKLKLDEHHAARLAKGVGKIRVFLARLLRRSRFVVECTTTTGARYRTSGEPILAWDDQLPWKRG